jgi:NAD(P)-dependent dehydrogenase (short-subunit alcohol dehydrogenase family)
MELKNKICLITGGTDGIGAAAARALAERGAHIAVTGRRADRESCLQLKDEVEARGLKFLFLQADAGTSEGCTHSVEATCDALGGVDVLIHSAGGPVQGGLDDLTEEVWLRAFDVHVHAVFRLCKTAVPVMKHRKGGAIILISSTAGLRGCNGALAYGVAKGALPQFARSLARELADFNIRVNCVSPGIIRTNFQSFLKPEQVLNNIQNRIPLHREGTTDDVASAIACLVENNFITGENLVIDGGLTMRIV